VIQLRPTSPIRPPGCVDDAVNLLLDHPEADSVRGVVASGQNPYKMWRIAPNGALQPLLEVAGLREPYNAPRQALPDTYWQTGHIDALRSGTITYKHSMSGEVIFPLLLDQRYTVDIDNLLDWSNAERMLAQLGMPFVQPEGQVRRPLPAAVKLVVFDFDGVFTDNRVWVSEQGIEMVAANRGDGMGIALLQRAGVQALVLSTESNPVVAQRCQKMRLEVIQNVPDKALALQELFRQRGVDPSGTVYLGNDVNDVGCFPLVACAVVPADAHPQALRQADLVLSKPGGFGAVREFCDLILKEGVVG
jgi:N-acylneuraminate cytidylyltransferase